MRNAAEIIIEQGIQGAQGIQGPAGPQGATGSQGPAGANGVDGKDGADGASFSVDVTGLLAELSNYDSQTKGFAFLATDTGNLYIKQSATVGDWSAAIPFRGPKGDTGSQGIQGEKGDKGDTGAQGAQGIQGIQGEKGEKGDKGDTGATGAKGDTGAQGPQGAQGPAGNNGSDATVNATNIAAVNNVLTEKNTLVDTDTFAGIDSEASNVLKKFSWANIKATLKTYLDTLYQAKLTSGTNIKTVNGNSLLGSGNITISGGSTRFDGYTTTATMGGTTTLTVDSTYDQFFTGTQTHSITLPDVTTLTLGWKVKIVNKSTQAIGVFASGGTLVTYIQPDSYREIECILLTGVTATSWAIVQGSQSTFLTQMILSSATITPNWNNGQMATLTLTTNTTLANPTNLKAGSTMSIKITQTGGKTIAYGTAYKFASGADKDLSLAPGAVDILNMESYDGSTLQCTLLKNFA